MYFEEKWANEVVTCGMMPHDIMSITDGPCGWWMPHGKDLGSHVSYGKEILVACRTLVKGKECEGET